MIPKKRMAKQRSKRMDKAREIPEAVTVELNEAGEPVLEDLEDVLEDLKAAFAEFYRAVQNNSISPNSTFVVSAAGKGVVLETVLSSGGQKIDRMRAVRTQVRRVATLDKTLTWHDMNGVPGPATQHRVHTGWYQRTSGGANCEVEEP